jgi:hypothetical protein
MKLTKEQYDTLPDSVKVLFKAEGDGYVQVAAPDPSDELKRAKDREKERAKAAEQKNRELEDRIAELETGKARKDGDIEALEKSWQQKLDTQKTEFEGKLAKKDGFLKDNLITSKAQALAAELSPNHASLLLPHITPRLTADLDGDNPTTKVLDATGQLSALTLDDLKKEFLANDDFKSIVVGSKATGGRTDEKPQFSRADEKADLSQIPTV